LNYIVLCPFFSHIFLHSVYRTGILTLTVLVEKSPKKFRVGTKTLGSAGQQETKVFFFLAQCLLLLGSFSLMFVILSLQI